MSEHQDWKTVYIGYKKKEAEKNKGGSKSSAPPRVSHKERKFEEKVEDGQTRTRKFDSSFGKTVQSYRQSQNLKQRDLAQKIGVPEKTIKDIEGGRAKYNPVIMSKLKRLFS
jgi:ribosome-binding protein aMBF1 (putative translation factor)